MADSRQGGSTDATGTVHGLEGGEDWEVLSMLQTRKDDEDGGNIRATAFGSLQEDRGAENKDGETRWTEKGCGNWQPFGGILPRLLPWDAIIYRAFYVATFGYLPVMAFVHGMFIKKRLRSVPLMTDLRFPVFFVFGSLVHASCDVIMHICTEWMRERTLSAPFGVFLLIKLLFRLSLFAPAKLFVAALVSGIKMGINHLVTAATLDAQDSYKICLRHLTYLPHTLTGLYGTGTSPLPDWWQNEMDYPQDDVLRVGACLYELLSAPQNAGLVKTPNENYGQHTESFVRENGFGCCVWASALCVVLLVIVALSKMLLDDTAAVLALYHCYTEERHRGAATRSEAFHAASRRCLRRTRYPRVARCMSWMRRVTSFISKGRQQLSREAGWKKSNNGLPAAAKNN